MAGTPYEAWLGRAREHHVAGRIIDAWLCYRRALREDAQGADARFHIAEIAWHMGQPAEAIAQWRDVCADTPAHAASWHALADACAARGDFTGARDAITHVLVLQPANARVAALRVLLDVADDPTAIDARGTDAIVAALHGGPWPLALLAHLAATAGARLPDEAIDALLAAALAPPVAAGDEDALRRIALATHGARRGSQVALVDHYVAACRMLHRSGRPLRWPMRCAGATLRMGVLVAHAQEIGALHDAIARAMPAEAIEIVALVPKDGGNRVTSSFAGDALRTVPIPLDAPDAAARLVASLDLDLLLDVAGFALPSAPLLAKTPARRAWALVRDAVPSHRALADASFDAQDAGAWLAALRSLVEEVRGEASATKRADELDALLQGALTAHQREDPDAARAGYEAVLDAQPNHAPARYLAGTVARGAGDLPRAVDCFRRAIDAAPGYIDARVALATALVEIGEADAAVEVSSQGLEGDPNTPTLLRALGQAELARGHASEAIAAFETALAGDASDADAHYNLGVALQTARRLPEAARAYQRALALRGDLEAAHFNLGVVFEEQGNVDAAIGAFSNVLRHAPSHVGAYKALADALLASGRIEAWFANFEQFEASAPAHIALAVNALEVGAYRGDFARVERYLDGLRNGRFTAPRPEEMLDALQQLLYLLHFFDVEPELIGGHARAHDALAQRLYGGMLPRPAVRRPGKLRIGYLSGDFRNHVMGKMMFEAVRHHDRERFDVFGYATTSARDEWTNRFAAQFVRMASVGALSDHDAAQAIATDDLDVLVDLSTHTKGARPGIVARKPARVVVTHVASAGTLALSAVDFKLTDRYADVAHDPALQIEPLLTMEGCVYPYRHVAPAPSAPFRRDALGVANDAVVIGAFSTPLKLSQRCLALWRDVFARVPNAVIAFSPIHPGLRDVFVHLASLAGIAASRVLFVPQGRDDAENQARYRLVDFVLDPLPYGGVNGTLEALDMGVPVATLVGRRHSERTSYSILANLGVLDTVAQSGADYVSIAVRLATDRAFMRHVRERIGAGLRRSALTDMPAHTRHLEEAYTRALERVAPEALGATS
jgi:predicted O-linked N-acetylglucosamine transferase (SPINDLY family)